MSDCPPRPETVSTDARFEPAPDQLESITRIASAMARRRGLSPDDAQDFCQFVHLRFVATHYHALRSFNGRSSLRTYLVVVIGRLFLDWRRHESGRWRPSSDARRRGPHAVALEQLIARDGCPSHDAIEVVAAMPGAPTRDQLCDLLAALPSRTPRVTLQPATESTASDPFVDPVADRETFEAKRRLWQALGDAIRRLPPDDRLLLDLRFRQGRRVSAIAEAMCEQPKRLHRRCDRILRTLRRSLVSSGLTMSGGTR